MHLWHALALLLASSASGTSCDGTGPACYIQIGSVAELQQADEGVGVVGAAAGAPCVPPEHAHAMVEHVNALNGGRGFSVGGGVTDALYYKLNYTSATFANGAWESEGRALTRARFPEWAYVVGMGDGGCNDAVTSLQMREANASGSIYMTTRGPPVVLEDAGFPEWAFSIHLSSDAYPATAIKQFALRGARTAALVGYDGTNRFLTGISAAIPALLSAEGIELVAHTPLVSIYDTVGARAGARAALGARADVLLFSGSTAQLETLLDELRARRDEGTFDAIWVPNVAWAEGSCGGAGAACAYALGATQTYAEDDRFVDGLLGASAAELGLVYRGVGCGSNATQGYTDLRSGVSAFVQAVQKVFEFMPIADPPGLLAARAEREAVRDYMRSGAAIGETFFGPVRFDPATGQNVGRSPTMVQAGQAACAGGGEPFAAVVSPVEHATGEFVYPAPSAEACALDSYRPRDALGDACALCGRAADVCAPCPGGDGSKWVATDNARLQFCGCEHNYRPAWAKASTSAAAYTDVPCEPCPTHAALAPLAVRAAPAECAGGFAPPRPEPHHWIDVTPLARLVATNASELGHDAVALTPADMALLSTVYKCPDHLRGNCVGGAAALADACWESALALAACVGDPSSGAASGALCAKGAMGPLCGECASDYFYSASDRGCKACAGSATGRVWAVVAVVVALVLVAWAGVRYASRLARPRTPAQVFVQAVCARAWHALYDAGRFKLVWSTYQIVSMVNDNLDIEWPEPFKGFERAISIAFQFPSMSGLLPLGCIAPGYGFVASMQLAVFGPLALAMVLVASHVLAKRSSTARERLITALLLLAYVVLPTTALACFQFFKCTELADGRRFLSADLSIECWSDAAVDTSRYDAGAPVAVIGIVLYPVLIPLLFSGALWSERAVLRAGQAAAAPHLRPYAFLFSMYEPYAAAWFDVADCYRRIVLTGLIVFMGDTSAQRAAAGCLIALASLAGVRELSPYKTKSNNPLALVCGYVILFTYAMAFLIAVEPFTLDTSAIGGALVPATLSMAALAFYWQSLEARRQAELQRRKEELAERAAALEKHNLELNDSLERLGASMVQLVVGVKTLKAAARSALCDRWGGKAIDDMTAEEKRKAAVSVELSTLGAKNDAEVKRLLVQAEAADALGEELPEWMWQEDAAHIGRHKKDAVRGESYVLYADVIAAQLEEQYKAWSAPLGGVLGSSVVEIDVDGAVRSTMDASKMFNPGTGTAYKIDFQAMTQTNVRSNFARKIRRVAKKRQGAPAAATTADSIAVQSAAQLSVILDPGDTKSLGFRGLILGDADVECGEGSSSAASRWAWDANAQDAVPPFPEALIEDANAHGAEPPSVLLVRKGMIVQVTEKRDDGWWYGYAFKLPGAKVSNADVNDHDADDDQESGAGWFPASFVGVPTPQHLAQLQELLAPAGAPASAADTLLAPPPTWTAAPDQKGPVALVDVSHWSAEYSDAVAAFKAGLSKYHKKGAEIVRVERVQNQAMWQSFVVKRQELATRERARALDNLSTIDDDALERKWLFHGTDAWTLGKICATGFNRSYAGRNACMYGKGVYFARDSGYSAHPRYAIPDAAGVQRMLLCRVLVGAHCKGSQDILVPDERDAGGILFDTTVDKIADPGILVTYHDAQAYPEYQISFRVKT